MQYQRLIVSHLADNLVLSSRHEDCRTASGAKLISYTRHTVPRLVMSNHQGELECVSAALPGARGRPAQPRRWSPPHHLRNAAAPAAAALQQTQAFRHCQGNGPMHALSDISDWKDTQARDSCMPLKDDRIGRTPGCAGRGALPAVRLSAPVFTTGCGLDSA